MEEQLVDWISRFSYPAVYLLLSATGVGVPISEDIVLLTAGTICAAGGARLAVMLPLAALGVLTADTLLFRIGAKLGPKVIEHRRLKQVLTPERVARVRGRFERWGMWTVFVARFVPGLRVPTFLLAGSMGVTQRQFWVADGAAVSIFAPAIVMLGWRFGPEALPHVKAFGGWALAVVAVVLAAAWVTSRLRARRA